MAFDLAFIWAALIAFAILVYVVLDGFDLGVGILFPTEPNEGDRDVMMNSVAPVWDGNETWLILGGGGLFAVFPLAYAVVMPAFYMPILMMLLALVFRGVAFEYRWRTRRWKPVWDIGFAGGSVVAAFCQGMMLGALVDGVAIEGRAYGGGWFDWLSPFSVLTGAALVTGYALLGATWLILKLEGDIRDRMRARAARLATGLVLAMGVVSAVTPFIDAVYWGRWFAWPTAIFTFLVPGLTALAAWRLFTGLRDGHDATPFLSALALFVLGFAGIGISFYPYIVPPSLTIWDAAAPERSLAFALVGASVLIPIILAYTAYAYWVFRGKIRPGEGYH